MMAERCTNERLAMTLHSIATALMIVRDRAAIRIRKGLAGHSTYHGRSEWTEEPPSQRSRHDTASKPQAISHGSKMVADYGPQTARLATAHFIPASPPNR